MTVTEMLEYTKEIPHTELEKKLFDRVLELERTVEFQKKMLDMIESIFESIEGEKNEV